MKKLLALVLCVMMFVSIIPTSAFAEEVLTLYPWIDTPIGSAAGYKKEILQEGNQGHDQEYPRRDRGCLRCHGC